MYIYVDIGGTKTRLVVSEDGQTFTQPSVIFTPQNFKEGLKSLSEVIPQLSKAAYTKCVVGVAGVLDKEKRLLLRSPNLRDWERKPLKEELEKITKCQVSVENDADLAGLGEAVLGAGKEFEIVAYITVGTGVGGTRIVGGKIDRNTLGFEPGHQIIDADGSMRGKLVDFEELVSGGAIEERYGRKPELISDKNTWDDIARMIAVGLVNTIVHWSPDVVVMDGGVIRSGKISMSTLKAFVTGYMTIFPQIPEIRKAQLEDYAALHGAAVYVQLK